jgi:hypothetical protein
MKAWIGTAAQRFRHILPIEDLPDVDIATCDEDVPCDGGFGSSERMNVDFRNGPVVAVGKLKFNDQI